MTDSAIDRGKERLDRLKRWDNLLQFARRYSSPRWVFRGHLLQWSLQPSVGRPKTYSAARELQLFNEFKRLGAPLVDRAQMPSDWDWLFLAQHHGLPTRLLDWTTNPLVAIYFACQPSPRGRRDGELIAVEIGSVGLISETDLKVGPFGINRTKFVFPTVVAPRIASQRGLFSVHAEPAKRWRLREKTFRMKILASDKVEFLEQLFNLGVDAAMLMSDLDGISQSLRWSYSTGKPII
ncbi:FRG domain-containing protein [Sphingorhabdus sp.]|uniref:FRG domain-containing protein n=1 Tax=Sphingorhabdus sp. TaxID=1902408 RepID=UPI0032B77759